MRSNFTMVKMFLPSGKQISKQIYTSWFRQLLGSSSICVNITVTIINSKRTKVCQREESILCSSLYSSLGLIYRKNYFCSAVIRLLEEFRNSHLLFKRYIIDLISSYDNYYWIILTTVIIPLRFYFLTILSQLQAMDVYLWHTLGWL